MLRKHYKPVEARCIVTFSLPADVEADSVAVVGDFNAWDRHATPMRRVKGGGWETQVPLEVGREYQFRYLLNDQVWINDPDADNYVPNPYWGENSAVVT